GNLVNLVTIPPLGSVFSVPSICQMGISSQVLWTKAFEDQCLNYISLRCQVLTAEFSNPVRLLGKHCT
uniref:Uncharacterized protein n=1 Tax=Aegilops tauschii subsp. strangulata TaxID=200361 RepID=A0A453BY78_AEGTS